MDASFFYLETPTSHMHIIGVIVIDGDSMPGGLLLRADPPALHRPPARAAPVPSPPGVRALRPRPPRVDRGRDLRLRRAREADRRPRTGHAPRAGRHRRAHLQRAARPQPPAVGAHRGRGPRARSGGAGDQDAPRLHRRRLGRRPAGPPVRRRSPTPARPPSPDDAVARRAGAVGSDPGPRRPGALGDQPGPGGQDGAAHRPVGGQHRAHAELARRSTPPCPLTAPRTMFSGDAHPAPRRWPSAAPSSTTSR